MPSPNGYIYKTLPYLRFSTLGKRIFKYCNSQKIRKVCVCIKTFMYTITINEKKSAHEFEGEQEEIHGSV